MGMFVKKNHGIEYLYSLVGKKHLFLGRKDDPDGLNQKNLGNAMNMIDKNFEKQLDKYIDDLVGHVSYMTKNSKQHYVNKRKNLIIKIQKVKII